MLSSSPAYERRHSGPCIIAGPAPCGVAGLAEARALEPDAPIIGINGMIGIMDCDLIVTCHDELIPRFCGKRYDDRERPLVHVLPAPSDYVKHSDYIWHGGNHLRVGSVSLCAAVLAKTIGFERVLIVGCPLDMNGYIDGYVVLPDSEFSPGAHRRGLHEDRRHAWVNAKKAGLLENCFGHSGYTRELLTWVQQ